MEQEKKKKKYSRFGINKTRCHNDSYFLLLEKRKLQSCKIYSF